MFAMKKLVIAALAVLAVPFSAKAEIVIGVGIPGPFYRPYYRGRYYYRPGVVIAAPPIIVGAAPAPVYYAPPPGTVYVAPPPGTVYVQPATPQPVPVYQPRP